MSMRPKPGQVTAFNGPAGSVWEYVSDMMNERELFVVLDRYQDNVEGQHPTTVFRMYLGLLTNEISWFADESHYNWCSQRIA